MTWRDSLQTASFRGVPFYYEGVTSIVGRRTVVHEYAGRDDAETEDLGRKAREFQIDAYVVGSDYDLRRDDLVSAFEQSGSGELVHPYWGRRTVAVNGPIRIQESTREGGMARVSVSVIEVGEQLPSLRRIVDTAAAVDDAASAASTAAQAAYTGAFTVTGAIEDAIDGAQTAIDSAMSDLRAAKKNINAALNTVDNVVSDLDETIDTLSDLVRLPEDLAEALAGNFELVFTSCASLDDDVQDLIDLGQDAELPYSDGPASQRFRSAVLMAAWRGIDAFNADGTTVYATGSQGDIEGENLAAVIQLTRVLAVVEAVRAASLLTFDSSNRAYSVLQELASAIGDLSKTATDDAEYVRLHELRGAFTLHVQSTAADLPRVVAYTLPETKPALVLAQELYGDPEMAEDIIARNSLRNPLAMYGVLEVLSA